MQVALVGTEASATAKQRVVNGSRDEPTCVATVDVHTEVFSVALPRPPGALKGSDVRAAANAADATGCHAIAM